MMVNAQMRLNTVFHLRRSAHLYLMKEMVAKLPLSRHWAVSMSSLCYCARWHAGWKCRLWYTRAFTFPFIISALYCKAPAWGVCVREVFWRFKGMFYSRGLQLILVGLSGMWISRLVAPDLIVMQMHGVLVNTAFHNS